MSPYRNQAAHMQQVGMHLQQENEVAKLKMAKRKGRARPKLVYMEAVSSDEDDEAQFTANPADDIPRNKLVEKLARGLQSFVQRAQKREGFRVDVTSAKESKWTPAPRECATVVTCDFRTFLIGGLNYEAIREITEAKVVGDHVSWERVPYTTGTDTIKGRQCHTSVAYLNKIFTFGGCFMFNKKRQVRECTN